MEAMGYVLKCVGLYIFLQSCIYAVEIQMNPDIYEYQGSNGSALICTWTLLREDKFLQLSFSTNSSAIVNIYSTVPSLSEDGKYLTGRVILGNLSNINSNSTHITSEARITFTDLQCVDDNIYSCSVGYSNSKKGGEITQKSSKTSKLNVKVLPSGPLMIKIVHRDRTVDTPTSHTKDYTTPGNSNLSASASPLDTQNTGFTLKDGEFIENDIITISCIGEVGNPPGNLTLQSLRNDGTNKSLDADSYQNYTPLQNCSYNQVMSFTINLTKEDDKVRFCCRVPLSNVECTDPIVVLYSVQTPVIKWANEPSTIPPLQLSCYAEGNPKPDYAWHRYLNRSQENYFDFFTSKQNITLNNYNDSGIYRCDVNNTVGRKKFERSNQMTFKITVSTTPTSTEIPNIAEENKGTNQHNIYYVIGGVAGGIVVLIVLVVTGIKCCGNRKPQKSEIASKPDDRLVHQLSTRQTVGADNYYFVSLDNDAKSQENNAENSISSQEQTRKHNETYLKQEREDNCRNIADGGHQPAEYAMVNKPIKGQSFTSKQEDNHQTTEYAQVNKVQKPLPNELPQDEDHYASEVGMYDHAYNRRHKQPTEPAQYDTSANINRRRSDKVGSVANNTGDLMKQRQVAKVRPSGHASYENDEMELDYVIKQKGGPNTNL